MKGTSPTNIDNLKQRIAEGIVSCYKHDSFGCNGKHIGSIRCKTLIIIIKYFKMMIKETSKEHITGNSRMMEKQKSCMSMMNRLKIRTLMMFSKKLDCKIRGV